MCWSLSAQPTSGHPNHRGRDGDDAAEYGQQTNSTHEDTRHEDHDQSNTTSGQTHAGRASKQTHEDAVPAFSGPVSPENRDDDW